MGLVRDVKCRGAVRWVGSRVEYYVRWRVGQEDYEEYRCGGLWDRVLGRDVEGS